MAKVYVLVELGYEYNDNTYDMDSTGIPVHTYSTREAVEAEHRKKSHELACSFDTGLLYFTEMNLYARWDYFWRKICAILHIEPDDPLTMVDNPHNFRIPDFALEEMTEKILQLLHIKFFDIIETELD